MRNIDENGLKLCRLQGKLFEDSLSLTECSSAIFIRRFMNSDAAIRLDNGSFLFESVSSGALVTELDKQYGRSEYGNERYSRDELYWIGYIYRYWAYVYQKSSKSIYKIISSKEMRNLYYPYHSLDPKMAIDRILEAKNAVEVDQIEKGVAILKSILKKKGEIK